MTAGTGGTITGVGRKLKEKDKNIQIIGVDPHGSILALPDNLNSEGVHPYKVEGIGYDFIPKNCDRNIVDKWYKCGDKDSFIMARRIIKEEGLLVGGSSGSCLVAAIQYCKDLNLGPDKRAVVVFVDGIRNYISKFLNDEWMLENGYFSQEEYDKVSNCKYNPTVYYGETNIILDLKLLPLNPIRYTTSCIEVLEILKSKKLEYVNFS
jgi:cystathionine beta-synthase